jgi:hypothetical protein
VAPTELYALTFPALITGNSERFRARPGQADNCIGERFPLASLSRGLLLRSVFGVAPFAAVVDDSRLSMRVMAIDAKKAPRISAERFCITQWMR